MVKVIWTRRAFNQLERVIKYIKEEQGISYAEIVLNKTLEKTRLLEKQALFDFYTKLKNYDKALDYLEKMYENSFSDMPYMATNLHHYNELIAYPRYIELLKKMNLPVD